MNTKQLYSKFFKQRHTKLLLALVLLDLFATIIWYYFFDIPEMNPILSGPIDKSIANFIFTKLALSLPSLYLINKFLYKRVSQIGMALLLFSYIGISIIHYFIFIKIITGW
jgi:hypothetical protein